MDVKIGGPHCNSIQERKMQSHQTHAEIAKGDLVRRHEDAEEFLIA